MPDRAPATWWPTRSRTARHVISLDDVANDGRRAAAGTGRRGRQRARPAPRSCRAAAGRTPCIGNENPNIFEGFDGNDILIGGLGADDLRGGRGNDQLASNQLFGVPVADGAIDKLDGFDGHRLLPGAVRRRRGRHHDQLRDRRTRTDRPDRPTRTNCSFPARDRAVRAGSARQRPVGLRGGPAEPAAARGPRSADDRGQHAADADHRRSRPPGRTRRPPARSSSSPSGPRGEDERGVAADHPAAQPLRRAGLDDQGADRVDRARSRRRRARRARSSPGSTAAARTTR